MELYLNDKLIINDEYDRGGLSGDIEYIWFMEYRRSYTAILYDIDYDKTYYLAVNISEENTTKHIVINYKLPDYKLYESHKLMFNIYLQESVIFPLKFDNIEEFAQSYNLRLVCQRSFTIIN